MHAVLMAILIVLAASLAAQESHDSVVPGWEEVVFAGKTRYRMADGCIRADARDSASGLVRKREIDLTRTPIMSWSWRADDLPEPTRKAHEKTREGDDFPARVYVIHKALLPWNSLGINYVWSRTQSENSHWPNPFTGNAMMVAVQSGPGGVGDWHDFSRNVREDFKQFFGLELERVHAVAIMTDTDNAGGTATVCYRLPHFSADS